MKHLQQLDVFVNRVHMESRILATVPGVKKLTLRYDYELHDLRRLLTWVKQQGQQGDSLPSVVNLYAPEIEAGQLLQFWSSWSSKLPSFEVGLYEISIVPIHLYPSKPKMKFQFGPAATPPLIKLSDYGILGLQYDTFHFTDYNHYGEVRHSITAKHYDLDVVKEQHFNRISNLYSVSNIDFCGMGTYMEICPGHLEQLAIACPNLERINLKCATNCLQSLKGLHAIVEKCQNLQGINLVGIHISCVEGNLLLWELLSSVKKLTHLAIDVSTLTHHGNCVDVDQQKLIGLLKSCDALKALEVTGVYSAVDCKNILFSHFPGLVNVRLRTRCIGSLEYTITNCHRLKYLYYDNQNLYYDNQNHSLHQISLPSSSSCHLQQLYISNIDLSSASVHVLSAHGELEQVILYDVWITTSVITTLISNSPNLILLDIILAYNNSLNMEDCKNTISEKFSNHKLFTVGDFFINHHYVGRYYYSGDFYSLWY